jgi:hypothetical protein
MTIKLDGEALVGGDSVRIPLLDDGAVHALDLVLGTDVKLTWPKK